MNCDHNLFLALNFDGGPFMDRLMLTVSGTTMWLPLYALILWLVWRRDGWRNVILFTALMIAALVLSDMISGIFKHNGVLGGLLPDFEPRWRPMFTPALEGLEIAPDSLRKLIDKKEVTAHHIEQLRDRLPAALRYIQENHIAHHPLRPETIIFTENIGNLKLIDVGFEQRPCLTPHDAREDVEAYGRILSEALATTEHPDAHLKRVAERCKPTSHHRLRDLHELDMALNKRSKERIYVAVIAFLAIMIGLLLSLNSAGRPEVPVTLQHEGVPSVEQSVNNQ